MSRIASPGFGLGLRAAHYNDILAAPCAVDWFEILSENYMVPVGKPLAMLDAIRRDYPIAMHGVSMSVGSAQGPDITYLKQLKQLATVVACTSDAPQTAPFAPFSFAFPRRLHCDQAVDTPT